MTFHLKYDTLGLNTILLLRSRNTLLRNCVLWVPWLLQASHCFTQRRARIWTMYERCSKMYSLDIFNMSRDFYVLLILQPCIILQINPTRCTILFNIFISLLYMFRASMCPSSGENYCIYATLVFVTLYGWRLVCWLDFQSNQQTSCHPYTVTNTSVA